MINLKEINLEGFTFTDELEKNSEENKEFMDALLEYCYNPSDENRKHLLEEICDTVQVKLSILQMLNISFEELTEYYNHVHNTKILSRPRKKGCSKCINSEPYKLNNNYFMCNGSIKDKGIDYAKECKCYEEQGE
jgi:hypothetical protein